MTHCPPYNSDVYDGRRCGTTNAKGDRPFYLRACINPNNRLRMN
ncbi:hypothetical protein [Nostoc sp.]